MQIYGHILVHSLLWLAVFSGSSCRSRTAPSAVTLGPEQFIVPTTPNNLKAQQSGSGVELSWSQSESASFYTIYWSNIKGLEKAHSKKIDRILKTYTKHSSLTPDKTYYYRVSATGSGGESPLSDEFVYKAGKTSVDQPPVATLPSLSSDGNTVIYLSNHCEAKLCLYVALNNGGNWTSSIIPTDEEIISIAPEGASPTISGNGAAITYISDGRLLVREKDSSGWSKTEIASCTGCSRIGISDDGSRVAWLDSETIYVSKKNNETWETSTVFLKAADFSLSGDGLKVVYQSGENLHLAVDQSTQWDHSAIGSGKRPTISSSGTRVTAFHSNAVVSYMENGSSWDQSSVSFSECCAFYPVISRDGDAIFQGNSLAEYGSNSWQNLGPYTGGAFYPSVSSDGKRVAYMFDDKVYVVSASANQSCGQSKCWDDPIQIRP